MKIFLLELSLHFYKILGSLRFICIQNFIKPIFPLYSTLDLILHVYKYLMSYAVAPITFHAYGCLISHTMAPKTLQTYRNLMSYTTALDTLHMYKILWLLTLG